ncbi:serine/threonine-protein kinase [Marinactinospora rubrisoli]|uniref:non-specific serine/threonine protein kinase n=1 Tax=Marinactinospora rubrisoli TaxID=2715399 RepID=A0ABW2KGU5_9ACTN
MSTEQSAPDHLLAGRYRMTRLIGEGGMGRVWQGTDELLDRPVAIKELTISPHLPQREIDVLRTRMLREARSAAQLSHPAIITVFDVVESDDRPWIVMELVRGNSLSEIIKRDGPQPPLRVAKIGLQMIAGLAVAHERGIVHRDIKPGNVLVAPGDRAVLTDFGIARLEGSSSLTSTGNLLGSPSYLAPEQARGRPASPVTDMWAFGVTLYAAVEGAPPFLRSTPMATLTAIVTEEVPPPRSAGPLLPVLRAILDKEPESRASLEEAHGMLYEVVAAGGGMGASTARSASPAPAAANTRTTTAPFGSVSTPSAAADGPPHQPAPVTEPEHAVAQAGSGGRRATVLLALAAVVLLAVIALTLWIADRSGTTAEADGGATPSESAAPAAEAADMSQSPADAEATSNSESTEQEEPDGPRAGMVRHEDETGFVVDVPEDWEMERRDGGVFFTNPDGGYLQIDQTDSPGENAREDWERQEGPISSNFRGYERVSITDLDEPYVERYISAADWEFTFDGSGGRRHAVNRAFHTEEKGYALFLVSTEEDWAENRALLDDITASFEPAA